MVEVAGALLSSVVDVVVSAADRAAGGVVNGAAVGATASAVATAGPFAAANPFAAVVTVRNAPLVARGTVVVA